MNRKTKVLISVCVVVGTVISIILNRKMGYPTWLIVFSAITAPVIAVGVLSFFYKLRNK